MTLNAISVLLLLLACLHAFYALGWWGAGSALGPNPESARHWAGYCLMLAIGVGLFLGPAGLPSPVLATARNLCLVVACLLMRRGLAEFGRYRGSDREHLVVLAAAMLASVGLGLLDQGLIWRSMALAAILAWVLLRMGAEMVIGLRAEFGLMVGAVTAAPPVLMGISMAARVVAIWIQRDQPQQVDIGTVSVINVALLSLMVVCSTLFQVTLVWLVMSRLVRKLRHLSHHDALTGLLNRRAWDQALTRERSQLGRSPRPTGLLMVDIDHFKRINDAQGHLAGDVALSAVARALRHAARETDIVARLGGEEFAVLLPDTDLVGAAQAAERLRAAVAGLSPTVEAQGLTVSVGAAVLPAGVPPGAAFDALASLADRLLYRAKAEGRNRVVTGSVVVLAEAAPGATSAAG